MGRNQVSGPTQTASKTLSTKHWESHPFFARAIRVLIFLLPVAISIVASIWASRRFPPEAVGLDGLRLLWWLGLAIASTLLVRLLERITAKLTPLAMLFRLSLIFPDQAPSRFSVALKTGSPRSLKRKLSEIQQNGQAFNDEETYSEQMLELVAVLANHDRMTRGHAERVRAYSELIGEEMGLSANDLGKLRWSALLHDMGKLHVPSEILNKPGRPDEREWAILKDHPAKAAEYLEPLADWLGEWRFAAVGHHERWDGNGYPAGQAGNDIPLSARIVAVADSYDVMTSTRSYKKPMAAELARQEIAQQAGSQFDPAVSRAFLSIGLGDLRRTAGPLAFLSNLPLIRTIPIGQGLGGAATSIPAVMTGAAAAAAVVVATPVEIPEPQQPPPAVAFADPSSPGIDADDLAGIEDENIFGSIRVSGDGPFTVTVIQPPTRGAVDLNTNVAQTESDTVAMRYTPDANQFGPDEFRIQSCDIHNVCVEQTISVSVAAVNDAPSAQPDSLATTGNGSLSIDIATLVANDTDIEDSALTIAGFTSPENGQLVRTNAALIFTPDPGFAGDTTFTYTTTDGQTESQPATVTVTVSAAAPTTTTTPPTTTTAPATTVPATVEAPVNERPTLFFNPTSLLENSPAGTAVGTAVGTDPEGNTVTYAITGGNGAQFFTIDQLTGEIQTTAPIDFESSPAMTLVLSATDASGATTSQTVTISIADVNEAPSAPTNEIREIEENSPTGTVVAGGPIPATDPEGDALTFTLIDPLGLFTIDPATGEISQVATAFDFETVPAHEVTVVVTDPQGQSSSTTVLITVLDENDAPSVQPFAAPLTIDENEPAQQLGQAVATDADSDTLNFSLSGPGSTRFTAGPNGEISTTGPLNFEDVASYTLTLTVTDDRNPALSSSTPVTIDVLDVNETPQLTLPTAFFVDENSPLGSGLDPASVVAVDVDGDTLTYGLIDFSNTFAIDPATGALSVTGPIDAEVIPAYPVSVSATDPSGLSAVQSVLIEVVDLNEPPALSMPLAAVPVQENSAVGSVVISVIGATDPESDTLTYSLVDPSGLFAIDASTAEITLLGALDFETAPNTYTVTVVVDDLASGGTSTVSDTLEIAVTNQNEAPVVPDPQTFIIDENPALGDSPAPQAVVASDVDGDPLTFALADPNNNFEIDPVSGVISVTQVGAGLDFEDNDTHPVVVTVTDPDGLSAQLSTAITVGDVNEAPVLIGPFGGLTVTENSPSGTTIAPSFAGTDPEGDSLTFTLTDPSANFTIDPVTGQVTVVGALNFEAVPNIFNVDVSVDDGANFDTRVVSISVTDEPEVPTIVTTTLNDVPESTATGATVATLLVTDEDGDAHTWSIDGGTGAGVFGIDPNSGDLTLNAPVDFEAGPTSYTLDITATGSDLLTDTESYTINIINTDEGPIITPGQIFTIDEEQPGFTPVTGGTVAFTDPEGDSVAMWQLADPTSSFIITATGQILSIGPLDFDGGPTSFDVDVTAVAPGGTSSETVTIDVLPIDERPTFVAGNPVDITVPELSNVGGSVGTLGVDNPESEPLTFTIDGGTGVGVFDIDPSSGVVELTGAIDFETGPGSYTLDVRVADADDPSLFDTRTVDLIISDDPEQAVLVRTNNTFEIAENVPTTSVVTPPVQAMDPDGSLVPLRFELMDDSGQFAINPSSGVISLVSGTLDRETQDTYPITINLYDDAAAVPLNDTWTTTITVTDVNEAPDLIAPATFSVDEDIAIGTAVPTLTATDPDFGDTFTFESLAGNGAAFFAIDPTTGVITTTAAFDFAVAPGPFELRVTVRDSGGLSDSESIIVTLNNINDQPIINILPTPSIVDSAVPGASLGVVAAFDPDGDSIASWQIVGGTGAPFFDIDATGNVSLAAPIDFDDASSYTLEIVATDDGLPALTSAPVTITVNVTSRFGPAPSPFFGQVAFNEVRFSAHQTGGIDLDRVEIVNNTNTVVDLTGWTLRDSPFGEPDPIGRLDIQFPNPGAVSSGDGRVTLSISLLNTGALRRNDDLFLFDSAGAIVAYMAWGDLNHVASEIGIRPPIDTWGLWDPTYEVGLTFTGEDSISVTPDRQNSTNSGCWERTGSGTAANCPGAPPTVDRDPDPIFRNSWGLPNTN